MSLIDVEGYKVICGIYFFIGIVLFLFLDFFDKIFMLMFIVLYVVKKYYEGNNESGVFEFGDVFYLGLFLIMYILVENIYFYEDEVGKF